MNLNSPEPYWILKTGERCKNSPVEVHPHDSSIVGTATSTLAGPARNPPSWEGARCSFLQCPTVALACC